MASEQRSLLLGAGHSREKKCALADPATGKPMGWAGKLVTLDMSPDVGADVVWDLETRPLPFPDECFDEIGAYDVLEHIGRQGDWRGWFDEWAEYWRILKPGGLFGAVVPIGKEYYADPGHTRFIHINWFGFLAQEAYANIDGGTPMTDYRWYWKKNFDIVFAKDCDGHHLAVMLRKS